MAASGGGQLEDYGALSQDVAALRERLHRNAGAAMAAEPDQRGYAVPNEVRMPTRIGGTFPLEIGPLGSRCAMLTVFFRAPDIGAPLKDGVWVRTGCFSGSLDAFEAAVNERHADNQHGREYAAAIAMIRALAALYNAQAE